MNHSEKLTTLLSQLKEQLNQAPNLQSAIEIKNLWFKNHVISLQKTLSNLSLLERKNTGILINQLKTAAQNLFDDIKDQFEQKSFHKIIIDHSMQNDHIIAAYPHWLNDILARTCEWFVKMNFQINTGNEVVSFYENFDLLNIGPNHPARLNSDSFYFDQTYMLRSHNTAHTAKVLLAAQPKEDLRIVTFGNVFRNDSDDLTHSHQFVQVDFIWVQKNLSLANLKWVIKNFLEYVFERSIQVRFRPSFFPFTEPSFEVDIACNKCSQNGCNKCKKTGWIEVLGSGMINQHVLKNTGYDPKKFNAIAAGVGIERLAMLKYNINDIRHFYQNDNRFFKVGKRC
ncbi:Phenylalanyl-tRNA synthetase alpha subunit [[Mycoplasma] cavipharyngis]|uniref:phenylalanine--tRNA ligase subunit alpha n=1 Tax=[Mycoplasma] cavipharyngis TaxID=92757 RepID=UPI003703EDC8